MSESTPSSTHSQVHALLGVYQSLASRYHSSNVAFELEVCNDADPLSDDGTPTKLVSSPLDTEAAESRIVRSIRSRNASVNSSRRPVAVLYADITPTESPGNGVSSLPPLLSYEEIRAILAGHSDEEEYTRYQSESSELDQHTADSEIFLTTRSKLLYGDHERDTKPHMLEIQEKAPQLELPEFDEISIEDLLASVIADRDKESGNSSEAGQLSASSSRSSFLGKVDSSNVTPRSRYRQRALKLRRRSATNFSPMVDRTVRTSPWYSAAVRRCTEVDYDQIHPDISWSVQYRFKQVLRELNERFRLEQFEKDYYQDVFISSENAHLALQLGNGDAVTPREEVACAPFSSPHTPVRMGVFRNGMQPSVGKLQLSRMTQLRQGRYGSPALERSSITAIPPSDKRLVNSNGRVVPRSQTDPAIADDQRTDTFSSIHAESGHTADVLKAYNRRRLTWSKISGKSTSKHSFRKLLTRPMKVQSVPTTPLSRVGSFMTTEYVGRSSESISGRYHKEKRASFASPVRLLLEKLHVKKQLKAAAKGAHMFRSLGSRRVLSRRVV
ncbi:hypothetical protein V1506DRAFT_544885 [Lipomyces tetrasporus]